MKKIQLALLLSCMAMFILSGCNSTKQMGVEIDSESIVSISISAYPVIFANGDSLDTTTDTVRIQDIISTFNGVTLEFYKSKEEWETISPAPGGTKKEIVTFYDNEKKDVGHFTRTTNADGTFIMRYVDDDVYIVSEKNKDAVDAIFNTLIEEAEDGRLDN